MPGTVINCSCVGITCMAVWGARVIWILHLRLNIMADDSSASHWYHPPKGWLSSEEAEQLARPENLDALRHSEKQKRTSELSWESVFHVPSISSCHWAEALTDLCYRSPKAADYTTKLSPCEERNSFGYCWVNKRTASGEESRLAYCLYYQRFGWFSKLFVPLSSVPATV